MEYVTVIMRRGARKSQYEIQIQLEPDDAARLAVDVINDRKWFTYHTPFGEPRLINVARFDVIDFKENKVGG